MLCSGLSLQAFQYEDNKLLTSTIFLWKLSKNPKRVHLRATQNLLVSVCRISVDYFGFRQPPNWHLTTLQGLLIPDLTWRRGKILLCSSYLYLLKKEESPWPPSFQSYDVFPSEGSQTNRYHLKAFRRERYANLSASYSATEGGNAHLHPLLLLMTYNWRVPAEANLRDLPKFGSGPQQSSPWPLIGVLLIRGWAHQAVQHPQACSSSNNDLVVSENMLSKKI